MSGTFMFSVIINSVGSIKSLCKATKISGRCVQDKVEMLCAVNNYVK